MRRSKIADKCDPAPLNEALWGDYQNWEKYFNAINTIFYTFWYKNDYYVTLLSKVMTVEHCYVRYHSKQLYRDMGCQRLLFMCSSMGQTRSKYSITPLSFHIFMQKSNCDYWAWYDKYFGRINQKWKILTLAHIFAYNSKSILPQRASFSHAGTQMQQRLSYIWSQRNQMTCFSIVKIVLFMPFYTRISEFVKNYSNKVKISI